MTDNQSVPKGAPSNDREYRRHVRNILIHKPMQREFMFVVILLFMISMFAIGFIIHYTIREAAFGGGFRFGKLNPYEVLSDVSYQLILWVSCVLFATLVVIGSFGIFFLHRIAGPVHRFRAVLRRLNAGHLPPPVKLREGDFFTEVIDELNILVDRLKVQEARFQTIRTSVDGMLKTHDPAVIQRAALDIQKAADLPKPTGQGA